MHSDRLISPRPAEFCPLPYRFPFGFWLWPSRLAKMAGEQGISACSFRGQGTSTRHMADHVSALLLKIQTFRVFTISPFFYPQRNNPHDEKAKIWSVLVR